MKRFPVALITLALAIASFAQQPTKAAHKKKGGGTSCGVKCGTERWAVKTLTDADAAGLKTASANDSTVVNLIAETAPSKLPAAGRVPLEKKLFHVQAVFLGFKEEASDHDFHIVIADPNDLSKQMIAEIPDATCQAVCSSAFLAQFTAARNTVQQKLGKPTGTATGSVPALPKPWLVEITAPAFFDFPHGQDGLAPNCIELHPVVEIKFLSEANKAAHINLAKELAHHCGHK